MILADFATSVGPADMARAISPDDEFIGGYADMTRAFFGRLRYES
jgi:hypothetical protein